MTAIARLLGKDPLWRELSPYELLQLERGTPASEVEPAFRRALLRRAHLQRITAAKLTLERQHERELLDVFLYDLGPLEPSPLREPGALEPARRAATAAAWETQLRRGFPDLRSAHSLALLWYWWAASASESAADPALCIERWRHALRYFAMLAAQPEFWRARSAQPEQLRERLLEKLRGELRALPGQGGAAAARAALEAALESEYAAGRALYTAGLRSPSGRLSCGPQLLGALGMLESVRDCVRARQARRPDETAGLDALLEHLCELAPARAALAAQRPADALAALERLGEAQLGLPEVARLYARTCWELGREQQSVQRLAEALQSWERGLARCVDPELAAALRSEIGAVSHTHAAALARRPEEARAVLERALALAPDPSMAPALAELVHRCGAAHALRAQQRLAAEQRATAASAERLSLALADLQRASQLGAAAAGQDARLVQQLLDELARAPGALDALREAISAGGPGTAAALRPRLAALLSNRAVGRSERALARAAQHGPRHRRGQLTQLATLRERRAARRPHCVQCDHCGAREGGQFYPLQLPGEPCFMLCSPCAQRLRGLADANAEAIELLAEAESDLREAAALDPGAAIAKNLTDVQRLLHALRENPLAASAAGSARPRWIRAAYLGGVALLLLYFFHDMGGRFAP